MIKMKRIYIVLIVFLVVVFTACSKPKPEEFCGDGICGVDENCDDCSKDCYCEQPESCGDNVCGIGEDCSNCEEDCGCQANERCDEIGVCRREVCGNDVCAVGEKNRCCEDCGCNSGFICNEVKHTCQAPINLDEATINDIVKDYDGEIIEVTDVYYDQETAKEVRISCELEMKDFPCEIVIFINKDGEVIQEYRTN